MYITSQIEIRDPAAPVTKNGFGEGGGGFLETFLTSPELLSAVTWRCVPDSQRLLIPEDQFWRSGSPKWDTGWNTQLHISDDIQVYNRQTLSLSVRLRRERYILNSRINRYQACSFLRKRPNFGSDITLVFPQLILLPLSSLFLPKVSCLHL